MRWTGLLCFIAVCATLSHAVSAQTPTEEARQKLISSSDLRADAALLRGALETIHPGLYRYNTPEQMAANFAALEESFGRDQTRQEAFIALSVFTARIKCGHTFPNPSNQSKAVAAELFDRPTKVPFAFRWLGTRMIVTRDFTPGGQLPRGTEILEIDGVPASVILERLMTIARADGSNHAKRVNLLQVTGAERFETFDIYFPLFFPPKGPTFELKIQPLGGVQAVVSVTAITSAARRAATTIEEAGPQDAGSPLWRLSYLPDGTAYLPMESWVAYKTTWNWTGFINETFDALVAKGVPNLVIDLRNNEGGSSVGNVILARLIKDAVPRSSSQRFVRYLKTPEDLNAKLDTWDQSFKNWTNEAIGPMDLADRNTGLLPGTTAGFYRLRNEDGRDPEEAQQMIEPRGPRYTGRVFVLVDASNSSATFEFASRVKRLRLGTLVGQPTGGNQRGINGGAFFFLRLPRTGFEVDLPIMAQFPVPGAELVEDAGIVPDVMVMPTVQDIAEGADPEMREVMRLIGTPR